MVSNTNAPAKDRQLIQINHIHRDDLSTCRVINLEKWDEVVEDVMYRYECMINSNVPPQDARGILPTNVCTSIIAQFSLRTLHEMANVRLCTRTQGEYQDVFRAMKAEVVEVHPWADDFIQVACVNTGVCIFPRYTECPVQKVTLNGGVLEDYNDTYTGYKERIKATFETTQHEAVPVAKDGMTMGYVDGTHHD